MLVGSRQMPGICSSAYSGKEERKYCKSLRQRRRNKRRNSQRNVSNVEIRNSNDETKPAASAGNGMSGRRHARE